MQDIRETLYSNNEWAAPYKRCLTRPPVYQYPMDRFIKRGDGCTWNITQNRKPWCAPRVWYFLNCDGKLEDTTVCNICQIYNWMPDVDLCYGRAHKVVWILKSTTVKSIYFYRLGMVVL